jgi:hypothetical protein
VDARRSEAQGDQAPGQMTAEEAEARARRLVYELHMELALRERDGRKARTIQQENRVVEAQQTAARLRARQEQVARFRTTLTETALVAAGAATAVSALAPGSPSRGQLLALAALLFLAVSVASLTCYALAVSRKASRMEAFSKWDWVGIAGFVAGAVVTAVAVAYG